MKISVVMTTYNGQSYLKKQLESLAAQTQLPDELIISDDASTDKTSSIISEFVESSPFNIIYCVNEARLGYSRNFNKALSLTTGDIVLMCDQDDFWLPGKIETVTKAFSRLPNTFLLIHDLEFCDEHLIPMGHTKLNRLKKFTNVHKYHVTGMASAVRSSFLEICLPIPDKFLSHDTWLHLCAYYCGVKYILPEVLALYRRHESSTTNGQFVNSPSKIGRLGLILRKLLSINSDNLSLSLLRHKLVKEWLIKNKSMLVDKIKVSKTTIYFSIMKLTIKITFLTVMAFLFKLS